MSKQNQTIVAIIETLNTIGENFAELATQFEGLGLDPAVINEATDKVKEVTETAATKTGKAATKKPAAKVEVDEDDEDQLVLGELTAEDLEEVDLKTLKAFATENDIEFLKTAKKPGVVKAILAAQDEMEDEGDDEEEVEGADISEMTVAELKSFCENNIEEPAPKKKLKEKEAAYADRLRAFIEEHLEDEGDEPEEDGEEELDTVVILEDEDGEEVEVDLSTKNVAQLKKFAKEQELTVTAKTKDALIEEILEQLYAEDGDEDGEDEEVDVVAELGLDEMELSELKEILEANELSTKGKKQALIDRIVAGVEDGTIEIDEEEGE